MSKITNFLSASNIWSILLKWLVICLFVGVLVGSSSAVFLATLDYATQTRVNNVWIIYFLPVGGLIIGFLYYYLGSGLEKGNDLLFDEYYKANKIVPFKMAPLVYIGTILTHLFGGSAGREGTAVQMGGAIAELFTKWLKIKLDSDDRKIILIIGVSAGFASVFGTPFTGVIFALEIFIIGKIRFKAVLPSIATAFLSYYICHAWNVAHVNYPTLAFHSITTINFIWAILASIIFGLAAFLFTQFAHFWKNLFQKLIKFAPLRPFVGGVIIALLFFFFDIAKFLGLGIPVIVDSFSEQQEISVFLLKILFTTFTLGAGFKGGEVTPLFFIGAALGSALVWFVPLPLPLLAGMGFVGVFAGATNAPLACFVMGLELFGWETAPYLAIACTIAYFFSGRKGIYNSQKLEGTKNKIYDFFTTK